MSKDTKTCEPSSEYGSTLADSVITVSVATQLTAAQIQQIEQLFQSGELSPSVLFKLLNSAPHKSLRISAHGYSLTWQDFMGRLIAALSSRSPDLERPSGKS